MKKSVVLIATLAVIAILTVIVLEFNYSSRVDLDIAYNFQKVLEAEYLAKSAINFAIFLLRKDEDSSVDCLDDEWAEEVPVIPIAGGQVSFKIIDEDRKLNINRIGSEKEDIGQLEYLLQLVGQDASIAGEILKKTPYETTGEAFTKESRKLADYLTVLGEGKVNINTAEIEVIESLSLLIDRSLAQKIVDFRIKNPFEDITQLSPAYQYEKPEGITEEIYKDMKNKITVRSEMFLVEAAADAGEVSKKIKAFVQRRGKNCKILYWKINYE